MRHDAINFGTYKKSNHDANAKPNQDAISKPDFDAVAFTNGCFDVLHAGHVQYLRFARSQGDVLLVGVNSDASIKRLKGEGRPLHPLGDRLSVLAALEMVNGVIDFDEDTPLDLIEQVTPDVLVKGEDWADKGVVGREWVESHGGQVILAPLLEGRSTSAVIESVLRSATQSVGGDPPAAGAPGSVGSGAGGRLASIPGGVTPRALTGAPRTNRSPRVLRMLRPPSPSSREPSVRTARASEPTTLRAKEARGPPAPT